ncbi:adenylate kinase [Phytophthora cinnamomi]|uniref:adenylate kinase n=1 Tax=Phytophthora cinnamomi TaxID=4785 RepID=UPI003559CB94|nr:adenylate kinase [Phytophthora cinnamomi]
MRVFITDLGSSLSTELARNCQDAGLEVVGTAARGGKSELAALKRQLQSHPSSDIASAVKEPVALQSDSTAWRRLVQIADVVVVTALATDTKLAMETLKAFEKRGTTKGDEEANEDEGDSVKRFIAVSSVLSWSKNAPFAASGADAAHVEDDFKSRRPARKYAELKTAETQILSAHRTGELETCIVGAGLVYGGAQSQLQLIFREAWLNPDRSLLVPSLAAQTQPASQGRNLLPMISLYDLALLVFRMAASPSPPPKKYLLAVDKTSGSTTLRDVCRGVSTLLASGRLRDRDESTGASDAEADALLLDEEEELVTPLQLHLCFDTSAGAIHTLVAPDEWRHYSRGLLGNLAFFVDDFIHAMDLRPLRTIVLGAPRVGKTLLSRRLARDYYLPYLSPQTLLNELFAPENDVTHAIPTKTAQADPESDGGQQANNGEQQSEVLEVSETQKLRDELQQWAPTSGGISENVNQIPETALVALLRWKLRSAACRNQGYVLDGLPISASQAEQIFAQEPSSDANLDGEGDAGENGGGDPVEGGDSGEAAGGEENAEGGTASPAVDIEALLARLKPRRLVLAPNRVVVLQAPRTLLEIRAQALSEAEAERTENTQEAFARRFDDFEANIEALETVFEKPKHNPDTAEPKASPVEGVEVLELSLRDDHAYRDEAAYTAPIQRYMEQGGRAPRNFHPTRAELREQRRAAEKQAREAEIRAAQRTQEQDAQDEAVQQAKLARERARLELLQREEAELLETRAKPLRTYLMDTVLPALTEGMLEVVKVQPTDPIDYLAEFLFRKGQELDDEMKEE